MLSTKDTEVYYLIDIISIFQLYFLNDTHRNQLLVCSTGAVNQENSKQDIFVCLIIDISLLAYALIFNSVSKY